MNNSIILTDDGSNSLFNNDINESYHSKHGAIKRKLKKIGFQIFTFPEPNGKREITQAMKI